MTRPTFLEGVLVALAASVAGSVLHTASVALLGAGDPWLLVGLLALGYVLYLLRRAPARAGRVTALAAWGGAAALSWFAAPSLTLFVLAQVGVIWLLRSLFFHAGPLAALGDLGLSALALGSGLWAFLHTGSLLLALWSFFLVQALFVALPQGAAQRPRQAPAVDRFELAHRAAEAAVQRLASSR